MSEDAIREAPSDAESAERPQEGSPNPTQERIDREGGGSDAPADVSWRDDSFGQTEPEGGA